MDKETKTAKPQAQTQVQAKVTTPKPTMRVEVVGDNVVITIPKKDLTKQLLAGLI